MSTGRLDQLWRAKLHPAGRTQRTSGIYCHLGSFCNDDDDDDDDDDDVVNVDNDEDGGDNDADADVQVYPAGHAWIHYALHQLTDAGWESS